MAMPGLQICSRQSHWHCGHLQKSVESLFCKRSRGLCKHKLDAASCKDEDAGEASGRFLNHEVYNSVVTNLIPPFTMEERGVCT